MTIQGYQNRRHLMTCEELQAQIGTVTLIDLRPAENFALGHIGGARHLDIYGVSLRDSSPEPLEAYLSMFHTLLGGRGVRRDRPVVFYDHESGERAARAVWLMDVLDHPDARMLEGGTRAWAAAGGAFSRVGEPASPAPPEEGPTILPPFAGGRRLDTLATRRDVAAAIDDESCIILDVRREAEWRGTEKRAKHAGTIPGAVNVFWRDHLDDRGALRPAEEVRQMYLARGIRPDKTIIPFCQGGFRSANTYLVLKALGYPSVRNYVGSWGEWGNRDDTRIAVAG